MKTVIYFLCLVAFSWAAEPSCKSSDGTETCKLPFKYEGYTYYSCTWRGNTGTKGRPWCSKEVYPNRTHVNSRLKGQAKTWLPCDSSCPIPSLSCSATSGVCRSQGFIQHCVENIGDTAISEWCIQAMGNISIHKTCPPECKKGVKDVGRKGRLLKPDSGTVTKTKSSTFCSANGPDQAECRVYLVTSASFLLVLLITTIIAVLYIKRRRRESERKCYNVAIKRSSINPGDLVKTMSFADENEQSK